MKKSFVADDDVGGKTRHLDASDRFHPELGIFHYLDLLYALLGKVCRSIADRAEIEIL